MADELLHAPTPTTVNNTAASTATVTIWLALTLLHSPGVFSENDILYCLNSGHEPSGTKFICD